MSQTAQLDDHFSTLPPELIEVVLGAFDFQSLLVCKRVRPRGKSWESSGSYGMITEQVCRTFRDVVDGSVRLQYNIELAMAGMEDVASCSMALSERLTNLREYRRSWDHLEWKMESMIPMQRGEILDLGAGLLVETVELEPAKSLKLTLLPSFIRGVKEKTWTLEDFGFIISDISIDPAHDLLVLIEETEGE